MNLLSTNTVSIQTNMVQPIENLTVCHALYHVCIQGRQYPVSLKGGTPPTSLSSIFPFLSLNLCLSLCVSLSLSLYVLHSLYLNKTPHLSSVCMAYLSLTHHEPSGLSPAKVLLLQNHYKHCFWFKEPRRKFKEQNK